MAKWADNCIRLLALSVIVIAADPAGWFDRVSTIPRAAIASERGNAYVVRDLAEIFRQRWGALGLYSGQGDTAKSPWASGLRLLEDGRPIGPPHSFDRDIAERGGGRYAHRLQELRFSSSDNSDPRANGRTYTVVEAPAIRRLVLGPGLLLAAVVAWRQRRGPARGLPEIALAVSVLRRDAPWWAATAALSAYLVVYYLLAVPPVPLVSPDSFTYWRDWGIVPVGYPLLLWWICRLFGSLHAVVIFQIALFVAAVATVQLGVRRVTLSPPLAGVTAILLLAFGNAASTAIWLMTESVVVSAVLFHVAAAACVFARPTRANLATLALTAVVAAALRPAAAFLVGGIAFLALFWRGRQGAVLRRAGLPLIVFALAYYGLGAMVRGHPGQSIAGLALLPHIVHLDDGGSGSMSAGSRALLDGAELRSYRVERVQAPNWRARQLLEMNHFNAILHDVFNRLQSTGTKSVAEINNRLLWLCFNLIVHQPVAYLAVVAENFAAWAEDYAFAVSPYVNQDLLAEYSVHWSQIIDFHRLVLNQVPGMTLEAINSRLTAATFVAPAFAIPKLLRIPIKIVFLAVTVVTIVLLIAGRADAATAFIAYVGILAFGGALLVAMSTVFIPRYAIPIDPLMLIVVVAGTWRLWAWAAAARARLVAAAAPAPQDASRSAARPCGGG